MISTSTLLSLTSPNIQFLPLYPLPTSCLLFFIISWVQIVLFINSWSAWRHPLQHGWPTRSHNLKENWLFFSQKLSATHNASIREWSSWAPTFSCFNKKRFGSSIPPSYILQNSLRSTGIAFLNLQNSAMTPSGPE